MKNNYVSGKFIKKSWLKLFVAFILAITLMSSYEKPIKVSAATTTPAEAFSYSNPPGGIVIFDVDTATYGTNIVVPNQIGGKTVIQIYSPDKGLTSLDVTKCTTLSSLNCEFNALTTLLVSWGRAIT